MVANAYSSETAAEAGRGRGPRGGALAQEDPDAAPMGRARGGPPPRVTRERGLNRFVWDVRNQAGLTMPPGSYHVRLKVGTTVLTQPFKVLIDPNVAADGVTVADLQEQYAHNTRMHAMVTLVNELAGRVRGAQQALREGSDGAKAKALDAIAGKLFTEPVRYGKPGLQAHILYLAMMTIGADQKIGRDAVERYGVLRAELEAMRADVDRLLGPAGR